MINPAELATTFEAVLNDNNLGLRFRLFYYIQDLDRRFEKVDGVNQSFIPAMITSTSGSYRPLPNANVSDGDFVFQIFYPQKYKDDVLICLDEFAQKVVGKKFTIDGKSIFCNMDMPIPASVQEQSLKELNDLDNRLSLDISQMYGLIQTRVHYLSMGNFMVGNDVVYSIKKKNDANYTAITRVEDMTNQTKQTASEQMLNADTSRGLAESNLVSDQLTIYLDTTKSLLKDIVEDMHKGTNQNQVYTLKIEYGTWLTIEDDVFITSQSKVAPLGNIVTLTLNFNKAEV